MDFSFSSLFSAFLFGVVGMWMFSQAKKNSNLKVIVISIALMIYPYFTHGPLGDWGVGILLCGLAYYFWYDD